MKSLNTEKERTCTDITEFMHMCHHISTDSIVVNNRYKLLVKLISNFSYTFNLFYIDLSHQYALFIISRVFTPRLCIFSITDSIVNVLQINLFFHSINRINKIRLKMCQQNRYFGHKLSCNLSYFFI